MGPSGGRQGLVRGTLARTVAAALAVLAGAIAVPAGAVAARPAAVAPVDAFGINGGVLWPDGNRLLNTAVHAEAIGRTGLRSVRVIPFWNLVEPEAPDPRTGVHRFDWRSSDPIARHLARHGLRWDALLGFSNNWGGKIPGQPTGAPRPGPFSQYAAAVAGRYGRRGDFWKANPDLPYVPMVNYQVWNEPNLPGIISIDAGSYAELYEVTRTAVLAVDPHARVAVAGLVHSSAGAGNASGYLRDMFRARPTLRGNIDAVGVTIYRRDPREVIEKLVEARRTLDDLGERDTPIDINETGWPTRGGVPLTDIVPISEEQRARYFSELVGRLEGGDCGVGLVTPFAWVTAEDNPFDASAWFGIAERRTAALSPSGRAFTQAALSVLSSRDAPGAGSPTCGRPDLPRLTQNRPPPRVPFSVAISRDCAARRLKVRYTLGPDPEPYGHFAVSLPGSSPARMIDDPDGAGPRRAATTLTFRLPRRTGRVKVVAKDELHRVRTRGSARLRACRSRRR